MSVVATTGSLLQRMMQGIRLSEKKRGAADARAGVVREREVERLSTRTRRGTPLSEQDITIHSNAAADGDPVVQAHIGGEQWGQRLTVMYGVAHVATTVTLVQRQLDLVVRRQEETNELLLRVVQLLESRSR